MANAGFRALIVGSLLLLPALSLRAPASSAAESHKHVKKSPAHHKKTRALRRTHGDDGGGPPEAEEDGGGPPEAEEAPEPQYNCEEGAIKDINRIIDAKGDYYDVLDLKENKAADFEQVKDSWEKLIRKVHPDKCNHPYAKSASEIVDEAYNVLKNPAARIEYDEQGTVDLNKFTDAPEQSEEEKEEEAPEQRGEEEEEEVVTKPKKGDELLDEVTKQKFKVKETDGTMGSRWDKFKIWGERPGTMTREQLTLLKAMMHLRRLGADEQVAGTKVFGNLEGKEHQGSLTLQELGYYELMLQGLGKSAAETLVRLVQEESDALEKGSEETNYVRTDDVLMMATRVRNEQHKSFAGMGKRLDAVAKSTTFNNTKEWKTFKAILDRHIADLFRTEAAYTAVLKYVIDTDTAVPSWKTALETEMTHKLDRLKEQQHADFERRNEEKALKLSGLLEGMDDVEERDEKLKEAISSLQPKWLKDLRKADPVKAQEKLLYPLGTPDKQPKEKTIVLKTKEEIDDKVKAAAAKYEEQLQNRLVENEEECEKKRREADDEAEAEADVGAAAAMMGEDMDVGAGIFEQEEGRERVSDAKTKQALQDKLASIRKKCKDEKEKVEKDAQANKVLAEKSGEIMKAYLVEQEILMKKKAADAEQVAAEEKYKSFSVEPMKNLTKKTKSDIEAVNSLVTKKLNPNAWAGSAALKKTSVTYKVLLDWLTNNLNKYSLEGAAKQYYDTLEEVEVKLDTIFSDFEKEREAIVDKWVTNEFFAPWFEEWNWSVFMEGMQRLAIPAKFYETHLLIQPANESSQMAAQVKRLKRIRYLATSGLMSQLPRYKDVLVSLEQRIPESYGVEGEEKVSIMRRFQNLFSQFEDAVTKCDQVFSGKVKVLEVLPFRMQLEEWDNFNTFMEVTYRTEALVLRKRSIDPDKAQREDELAVVRGETEAIELINLIWRTFKTDRALAILREAGKLVPMQLPELPKLGGTLTTVIDAKDNQVEIELDAETDKDMGAAFTRYKQSVEKLHEIVPWISRFQDLGRERFNNWKNKVEAYEVLGSEIEEVTYVAKYQDKSRFTDWSKRWQELKDALSPMTKTIMIDFPSALTFEQKQAIYTFLGLAERTEKKILETEKAVEADARFTFKEDVGKSIDNLKGMIGRINWYKSTEQNQAFVMKALEEVQLFFTEYTKATNVYAVAGTEMSFAKKDCEKALQNLKEAKRTDWYLFGKVMYKEDIMLQSLKDTVEALQAVYEKFATGDTLLDPEDVEQAYEILQIPGTATQQRVDLNFFTMEHYYDESKWATAKALVPRWVKELTADQRKARLSNLVKAKKTIDEKIKEKQELEKVDPSLWRKEAAKKRQALGESKVNTLEGAMKHMGLDGEDAPENLTKHHVEAAAMSKKLEDDENIATHRAATKTLMAKLAIEKEEQVAVDLLKLSTTDLTEQKVRRAFTEWSTYYDKGKWKSDTPVPAQIKAMTNVKRKEMLQLVTDAQHTLLHKLGVREYMDKTKVSKESLKAIVDRKKEAATAAKYLHIAENATREEVLKAVEDLKAQSLKTVKDLIRQTKMAQLADNAQKVMLAHMQAAGIDDFVTKPVAAMDVAELIEKNDAAQVGMHFLKLNPAELFEAEDPQALVTETYEKRKAEFERLELSPAKKKEMLMLTENAKRNVLDAMKHQQVKRAMEQEREKRKKAAEAAKAAQAEKAAQDAKEAAAAEEAKKVADEALRKANLPSWEQED